MKISSTFKCLLINAFLLLSFTNIIAKEHTHNDSHPTSCTVSEEPIVVYQSDSTSLTIIGKGNINNSWTETIDGYSLVLVNGIYEYAQKINGSLTSTGIKANDPLNRTSSELTAISSMSKSIKPDPVPLKNSILNQVRKMAQNKTFPSTGNIRILALLIDYPDLQSTYTINNFDSLFTSPNHHNGDGSFKSYYETSSNGQLTITVDVHGWYRAVNNFSYYGRVHGHERARELTREAVDAAEIDGVDFSLYDNDNDGVVDGILAVHAGPGAEQGSQTQYIWSHRWVLGPVAVTYDGKLINDYMMNPETRTGNNLVGIGVFCHEFGHNLGLPDLYDTDPSNGDSEGIGNWCLMAGAGWLGGEHRPGNMSAWCKIELGWEIPTSLTIGSSGIYTLDPSSTTPNEIFKIDVPGVNNEYFLLENRQKVGLDQAIPGHGMAIWHINTTKTNSWGNSVNADEMLKGVDLEEADGFNHLDNEVNRGDQGDLYPGTMNRTIFNDVSNPNSQTYLPSNTGILISNIVESGNQISFNWGNVNPPTCSGLTTLTSLTGTLDDGSGNNDYSHMQNCSWLIEPTGVATINLQFNSFNTEAVHDSVTVYDGNSAISPIIGTFSGNSIPSNITSSSGALFITFKTNNNMVKAGWEASYTSVLPSLSCSGITNLTSASASFEDGSNASNYDNNLNCGWLIQPSGASLITFTMDNINLAIDQDIVNVYEGTDNTGSLIASYSGTSSGSTVSVSGSSMYVEFITNASGTSNGWNASYTSNNASTCSGSLILSSNSGSTFTDGSTFNSHYSDNLNCSWLVQPTNPNVTISLDFNRFDTETGSDTVTIYDGTSTSAPVLGTFSGNSIPSQINSTGSSLFINFKTNSTNRALGWEATYFVNSLPHLSIVEDTITLGANSGSIDSLTLNANVNWNLSSTAPWLQTNVINGANSARIPLETNQTNNGFERYSVIYITDNNNTLIDSLVIEQLGQGNFMIANKSVVYFTSKQIDPDTISISANVNWSVTSNVNWLSFSTTSGSSNDFIEVIASSNTGPTERIGLITISGSGGVADINIQVLQHRPLFVDSKHITLDQPVNSSSDFKAVATYTTLPTFSTSVPWISTSVNVVNGILDTSVVSVFANSANQLPNSRHGYVVVHDINETDTVWISQDSLAPFFSISSDTVYLNNSQGSQGNFSILSNVNWSLVENSPWLIVNPLSGSQTQTIDLTAASSNNGGNSRHAIITASSVGFASKTITIIQSPSTPLLSISKDSLTLGSDSGDVKTFNVSSNLNNWSIQNNANWFTVTPTTGSFTSTIEVMATNSNTSSIIRAEVITLSAPPFNPIDIKIKQDTIIGVGLENFTSLENSLKIYPNPTRGELNVQFIGDHALSGVKVYLFDALGKEVDLKTVQSSNHSFRYDLSHLKGGIYYLMISNGEHKFSKKISVVSIF